MKTEINTDGSLLTFKYDELKDGTAFKNWIIDLDLDYFVHQFAIKLDYYNDSFGNGVHGYVMPDGYMLDFVEMLSDMLPIDTHEDNCVIIDRFLCEIGIKNAFLMYHDSNISVLPRQDQLKELDMTTDEGIINLFKGVLMYLIEKRDGVDWIEEEDYKQHKWDIDDDEEQ